MLSIGKLAAGQAKYYLDQAEARVDVVQSVGSGVEDYYLGPHEARGRWIGSAGYEIGLRDDVGADALRRVLAGAHPQDGRELRSSSSRARVAGFDLTFSAPKSVSVLFGIGEVRLHERVRAAHDIAVLQAAGYLERNAAAVRRGHGGVIVEEAPGLIAAAFRHRTSRAGDPQLHTHVLVANLGRGLDGRWSALDGRRLYAHARTASFVYQAVLRSELTRTLGIEWSPVRKGIAEVVGVPRVVMKAFSRRRAEIDAALEERGTSGARAAEAAALATRAVKSKVDAGELVAEWKVRAGELGFGERELALFVARVRGRDVDEPRWEKVFDALVRSTGITSRSATFSTGEVIQALCEALPTGNAVEASQLERAAKLFLETRAVALVPDDETRDPDEVFRRRDGRVMPVAVERTRYSTPEHLALEQRFIDRVASSRGGRAGMAGDDDVERAIESRSTLSEEQRRMVEALCLSGDGVAVVAGKAGTGKTFALGAAREAWQAAGFPVLGVAAARRAANEMQTGAGIQSTSIAALLGDLRRGGGAGLPRHCVLVVDEAGVVPTRELAELVDQVGRVEGKVVLIGDHRQLPEIGAGGAFRGLVQRGLAIELTENVRQVNRWERVALDHLREGRADEALGLYASHERLVVEPTSDDIRTRLVADWLALGDSDQSVMIARLRADVADLNSRARMQLRARGDVSGPEVDLAGGSFGVGDRVVVKQNDSRLGVSNGQRGRVTEADPAAIALALEVDGRRVRLDREFLHGTTRDGDPTLLHGYAITGHVAQGLTVDHSLVLASGNVGNEWAYVALSRGRESNRLYVAEREEDGRAEFAPVDQAGIGAFERLRRSMESSEAQVLAIDSGRPASREREDELAAATRERRALEERGRTWLPGRRRRLDAARARELAATRVIADERRAEIEQAHGSRPFEVQSEDDVKSRYEAMAERATQRVLGQQRGREL
ncbi:relaxase domain-containing protein [Solirubrobacter ginsenosidimutans]|uniref:Relaxase domain-containing protein n=1 Tax=Solirubrobacter ginsenosidimutans TaxID=490573 RepID=A0A9X3N054_9ACTN|nr:MobF family relaxase [Solirubrobacter ginsenosidimutans]MDA0166009.1 relaxase domain-containing protein [Solirubrobacter ginsenosidimutans]